MKKILVYTTGSQGLQEVSQREEAILEKNNGNDVLFLCCDDSLGICIDNPLCNKARCFLCKNFQKSRAQKLGLRDEFHFIGDYITKDIINKANNTMFAYSSIAELKSIVYDGVEIGYGAVSSYVSLTRNIDYISAEIKEYLDVLLRCQIKLIEVLKIVFSDYKPDLVYFHNGRFAQYKPLLDISKYRKVDFICTEGILFSDGLFKKNYFINDIAHSVVLNTEHYMEFWDNFPDESERIRIGRSFFENRRFGKYAGDKIYTSLQQHGKLPDKWDKTKQNIVIFNSSEDEFFSISKEVDAYSIFNSQIDGITTILEHYRNDATKHFYLRVHPNLNNIHYAYHMDLYKLEYPNLTVIPGTSDISSYALLDAADKVVAFGSTMGVEAAYWQKPVICLGYALYNLLNVVYTPKSINSLWDLLETKDLPLLNYNNALKYGLYYMSTNHPEFIIEENSIKKILLFGRKYLVNSYNKFLGSYRLFILFIHPIVKFLNSLKIFRKFDEVPR